jgi:hypothetical protein
MNPSKLKSKLMLSSFPEIQIINDESTFGYTYPTFVATLALGS